ncbi:MAG TPA: hypothetical protein PKA64_22160 [Myxococcota bacterium]|nr:hypothetical protein [Myxococcota bacterium]
MRALALAPLLLGCAAEDLLPGQAPPPMTLELTGPVVQGAPFTLTVSGASPGDRVWLGRGGPLGCCVCPPSMGGACLGVTDPAVLTSGRADAAGGLARTFTVPATVPYGTVVSFQAAVVDGSGSYVSAPVEAEVEPADPLQLLDDGFDGASLTGWGTLNDGVFDLAVTGGQLVLDAAARSSWHDAGDGPLVYRTVSGDFVATAVVGAVDPSRGGPPLQLEQLVGLMAHHANGATDSHVFVAVGNDDVGPAVEASTTRRAATTTSRVDWASNGAELRLCRYGTMMRAYRRAIGAPIWELAGEWARLDLLGDLLVGPMLHADQATPGLRGLVESVRFSTPADALDCQTAP